MRLLQISNYLYPHIGGIEQVARDFANAIKSDKLEQKIICFNHEKGTNVDFVDDVEVTRVGCFAKVSSQSLSFSYGKELKKLIKSFNPEVVVFHYPNPFVAHYLLKYRKKYNFKLVLYWHLDITKQKILGKLFKGQSFKLLKWATKVVATSPNYIEGSPFLSTVKEKCTVIPCCVNKERLVYGDEHLKMAQDIKNMYPSKKICFAFGRHVEYKGIGYLVKASKYLSSEYQILIGGKGPLTDDLMKEASNDEKIKFLGRISDDELKANLLACDVFCFPSITKNEAFGIGLAEAMYYENACVTFNIPGSGVNYVSINGETGIEVENGNVEAYAKAIEKICNNEELRTTYALNAKTRCKELFMNEMFDENVRGLIEGL